MLSVTQKISTGSTHKKKTPYTPKKFKNKNPKAVLQQYRRRPPNKSLAVLNKNKFFKKIDIFK
jgi:hypothetical protein